jgi:hypothetical protein
MIHILKPLRDATLAKEQALKIATIAAEHPQSRATSAMGRKPSPVPAAMVVVGQLNTAHNVMAQEPIMKSPAPSATEPASPTFVVLRARGRKQFLAVLAVGMEKLSVTIAGMGGLLAVRVMVGKKIPSAAT